MGYKEEKELFVADGQGSSLFLINAVCSTALTTYALWKIAARYLYRRPASWSTAALEYAIIVLPLLLVLTVLSSVPALFNLFVSAVVVIVFPRDRIARTPANPPPSPVHRFVSPPGTPLGSASPLASPPTPRIKAMHSQSGTHSPSHDVSISDVLDGAIKDCAQARPAPPPPPMSFSRPYLTAYRAHMILMTALCILAVDFPLFPRAFGKTETWGTSLMDVGVGSFVFSYGIVSAIPVLRADDRPLASDLRNALTQFLPLLLMGLARVLMVKGVDLPEHVTEYGVHWSFFITLAILPFVGVFSRRYCSHVSFSILGAITIATHQIFLSSLGLASWCLTAPRTNLLSANKEGLSSLLGYCAIYILGIDCGLYALPPDPYFAKSTHQKKLKPNPGKTATLLASWSMLWWLAYGGSLLIVQPSRRMANATYVLWIVAMNVTLLLGYVLVSEVKAGASPSAPSTPLLLEAINKNGLAVFLIANLLTGLVNLSIESMYASDATAVAVLLSYSGAVCSFAWAFRRTRLKI